MKLTMFQVDAFAEHVFEGNPAAVCPLEAWLDDSLLQAIAAENNLSETAYFVPAGEAYELRWFTPLAEVPLCGHATLASAHVLYEHLGYSKPKLHFTTRSSPLTVFRSKHGLRMDFPAYPPRAIEAPATLLAGLNRPPTEVLAAVNYLAVYETEDDIRALSPDLTRLFSLDKLGVVATAPGRKADFVSRCFFPHVGVDEDPVTGSAHCELAPYWSERLGRKVLRAHQLSKRGGALVCEVEDDRVLLTGRAVTFMSAEIEVPQD